MMVTDVHRCSPMFTDVYRYSPMFTHEQLCPTDLAGINVGDESGGVHG